MATTSLTKVGNSMAVLLPKTLRAEAGIESDTRLSLSSPRKGVVVITALQNSTEHLSAQKSASQKTPRI